RQPGVGSWLRPCRRCQRCQQPLTGGSRPRLAWPRRGAVASLLGGNNRRAHLRRLCRPPSRKPPLPVMKAATGLLLALLTLVLSNGCVGGAKPATITIHFSKFGPGIVVAVKGQPLTIVLRNDDPIEHEWIVGPEAVHERHRLGTEPFHDTLPTEVTIPALSTRTTTIRFAEAGDYAFICHLPGHEAYGMRGVVHVVDR